MYSFQSEIYKNKFLKFAVLSIYGLSKFYTQIVFKKLGFSDNLKLIYLKSNQILELVRLIELIPVLKSSHLKKYKLSTFQNLIEIKTVKSKRLLRGLPVRGQRTRTNSKTSKKSFKIL